MVGTGQRVIQEIAAPVLREVEGLLFDCVYPEPDEGL
jgi:hypothetical protein